MPTQFYVLHDFVVAKFETFSEKSMLRLETFLHQYIFIYMI